MAVYRADQAQVTFMTEPAAGGYVEMAPHGLAVKASGGGSSTSTTVLLAGARFATLASVSNFALGDVVCIGYTASGSLYAKETEIRNIDHIDTAGKTIYFSSPLGFNHPISETIAVVNPVFSPAGTSTGLRSADDQYITLIPGAYETVDVPDPEMAIEGRWFLGTQAKRNFYAAYSGQQSYTGSIGSFALLNGKALRYPIGKVETSVSADYIDTGHASAKRTTDEATQKGDLFISTAKVTDDAAITTSSLLIFGYGVAGETTEVRKSMNTASSDTALLIELDYPLQFPHAAGAVYVLLASKTAAPRVQITNETVAYTHNITETVDLDSISWHVHMLPSDEDFAKSFDRRYFGGKVGSMTITAEEGGMVTASWDGVNFLGMVHNQKKFSGVTSGGASALFNDAGNLAATATTILYDNLADEDVPFRVNDAIIMTPDSDSNVIDTTGHTGEMMLVTDVTAATATTGTLTVSRGAFGTTPDTYDNNATIQVVLPTPMYAAMQSIESGKVAFPTTEPYYFSNGEVKMFGQTIARIRNFSLSIANNEEPRYYITKQMGRRRGPTEIREQRREYSLAVTLALPDATEHNHAQHTVFQEMLLEGNYGNVSDFIRQGKKGFDVSIELVRGEVISGTEDKITITIPDDGAAGTGGNNQGAFIRTAPHNITEDNPFQVEADILFRNLKIDVQDAEHYYP